MMLRSLGYLIREARLRWDAMTMTERHDMIEAQRAT